MPAFRIAVFVVAMCLPVLGTVLNPGDGNPGNGTPHSWGGLPPDKEVPHDISFYGPPYSCNPNPQRVSGTCSEYVIQDPQNVYCSSCLDFGFVVSVSSAAVRAIMQLTVSFFTQYLTDGGYPPGVVPGIIPDSVGRTSNGQSVFFNFDSFVQPGQQTQLLVVETNALSFNNSGALQILDSDSGVSSAVNILGPVPVPEPSTLFAAGFGLALLAFLGSALIHPGEGRVKRPRIVELTARIHRASRSRTM